MVCTDALYEYAVVYRRHFHLAYISSCCATEGYDPPHVRLHGLRWCMLFDEKGTGVVPRIVVLGITTCTWADPYSGTSSGARRSGAT